MDVFEQIKQEAIENHIPIIMDDTLEVIASYLEKEPPTKILEIGTAVGYSAICFSKYLSAGRKNRHHRIRRRASYKS